MFKIEIKFDFKKLKMVFTLNSMKIFLFSKSSFCFGSPSFKVVQAALRNEKVQFFFVIFVKT